MFAKCCVCDHGEKPADVPMEDYASSQVRPDGDPPEAMMAVKPAESARSAESSTLSPEEKMREKMRLQELVKQFARDSLQGVQCVVLDPVSARKTDAMYKLDPALSRMQFSAQDGTLIATIPVAQIEEISRFDDLVPEDQKALVQTLSTPETRTALLVRAKLQPAAGADGSPATSEVYLLMEEDLQKERFITCVKILRLYCQTSTPASGDR